MILFIIIISIIAAVVAVVATTIHISELKQKKYEEFVLQNSISLKQLTAINNRYAFCSDTNFDQYHTYDNEKFFDTISCTDYLIYQLQFIKKKIVDQIDKVNYNKKQYAFYQNELKILIQPGQFLSPIGKLKLNKLKQTEEKLITKQIYPAPRTEFYLQVTLNCSKINGQTYRRKSEYFSADKIFTLIEKLNERNGTYYTDSKIWEAICRVERGKVSNKMRFAIYARDGYRCRKCGAGNGYAQLEIDHIIPIAKGGKSTFNNLQTLCHRCNVIKGDSLD